MADKSYPMTAEGKKETRRRAGELKTKKRPEVIDRTRLLRGFGRIFQRTLNMKQLKMNNPP